MEIARDYNFQIIERNILKSELYTCDEAFFTGTAAEITPILEVDHRRIGDGIEGKITSKLKKILSQAVLGKISKYGSWITLVKMESESL